MWQAEAVDPWIVGLVALVVIGLGAIVFGALSDRAKNRRRAAEMLAPPQRSIPRLAADAAPPSYLSDLQARRPPAPTTARPRSEQAAVTQQLSRPETTKISVGYASKDFVTDPAAGWALLDGPAVLVCADEIASIRELLPTLEKLMAAKRPLVVVAPSIAREVRATLEVNQIRRLLAVLAVEVVDEADRQRLAERSGATITTRSDRQAGYVLPSHLGRVDRWVSTKQESFLIGDRVDRATA